MAVDDRFMMHVDIDAFFASVEQVLDPELRGRPVVVGGGRGGHGVVASASYEARRFGLTAGMPIFRARELCPHAVCVGGRFEQYNRFSERVLGLVAELSPAVERVSLDEARVDLRGCRLLHGVWSARPLSRLPFVREAQGVYRRCEGSAVPAGGRRMVPERVRWAVGLALRLKRVVRVRTGLTVSVGIGANAAVARMACSFGKPDGLAVVVPGAESAFLGMLDLRDIPGVGRATREKLHKWNVHTVEQARRLPLDVLQDAFGREGGRTIFDLLRGAATDPPGPPAVRRPRSIGREVTFWTASNDYRFVESMLFELTERLGRALRREGMRGRAVHLKLRYDDFATVHSSRSLPRRTDRDEAIFAVARRLLRSRWRRSRRLRLVGVRLTDLKPARLIQCKLFDTRAERGRRLERCLDGLRDRFGFDVIRRGPAINPATATSP